MGDLDVGGRLGVDYDGSKTHFSASKNDSIQNYANNVAEVQEACSVRNIPAPMLIRERRQAISFHQSVLVFDMLDVSDRPV